MGPVAAVGDDVWVSWDVEHGFGLDDDPAEAGRFPADDSTRSIAVQQREALVTELEEN
jgi:spermidine/putrescine transport system ATP-binding protein